MRAEGRMCWQGWFGRAGFIIENIIVFGKGGNIMKKRIIAVLLAVAVAAGGEGTLAQAASDPIEMEEYTETAEPTREAISGELAESDFEDLEIVEPEEEKEQDGSELEQQGKVLQETSGEAAADEPMDAEAEGIRQANPEGKEKAEGNLGLPGMEVQETVKGGWKDGLSEARPVALGDTVSDMFTDNRIANYYKVTLPSAGSLTLHMRSTEVPCFSYAICYDETGENYVYEDDIWWNQNLKLLDFKDPIYLEPGTYYICLTGRGNLDWGDYYTGSYTCGFQFISSGTNDGEPNNSFEQAKSLGLGVAVTGQISWNDKEDYYRVALGSAGKLTLNMASYMGRYDIAIYDSEQKRIWNTYEYLDENATMRQDAYGLYLEEGIYYILIYKDSDKGTGVYKLSASFVSSQTTFSGDDNSAVNARPIGFGSTYKGQLSLNDDYDTYKFSVAAGRNIPVSFRSNMRTYTIKVYDAAGKSVWTQDPDYYSGWSESSNSRKDSYTVTLSAGTYYMEVSRRSDWTGTYEFSLGNGELTSLKLSKKSLKLVKGDKYQLTALMEPVNCAVTWKSGNSKVVSVKSGKVTAKGYGQASVTCYAQDGSKKQASCKVTVVPAKAKVSSIKNIKSGKKINIKSQSGVTGYEVQAKTKRGSWKKYKTIKGSKNKSFKVSRKYYDTHTFRIRAYKQIGKKRYEGAFSKTF